MTELINKDMTIGDIVQRFPQVGPVFQNYGLHCVGCGVAYWETIEQGALGHGMDEETIDQMIRDANTVAEGSEKEKISDDALITLTEKAASKVKEFIAKSDKPAKVLRFSVRDGGCAGQSYDLALEVEASSNDEVLESQGVTMVVEKELLDAVKGVTVDYVDALQGSGFKIKNPNAKATCGCGNSFS